MTHDQEEALALSTRIAVMNRGEVYEVEVGERLILRAEVTNPRGETLFGTGQDVNLAFAPEEVIVIP